MLSTGKPTSQAVAARPRTHIGRSRLSSAVICKSQAVSKDALISNISSAILAAVVTVSTGNLVLGPVISPPAAYADEGTDKRKAELARRKALLEEYRAKAEAGMKAAPKTTEEADAAVEKANEERARLAAARAAAIKAEAEAEYKKQAANAVQTAPPV